MYDLKRAVAAATVTLALSSAPGALADELTGTLKKVKETGVITLGFRDASVPFSYLDGDQKPVGYALDICRHIVDAVKVWA